MIAALVVYIITSALCATSVTIDQLVTYRFLHVLCSGAAMVIARSIVHHLYDRDGVARILSLMMLVMRVAPMMAPRIGGQILILWDWRAIFWLLTGFGCLCRRGCRRVARQNTLADDPRHRSLRPTLTRCIFQRRLGSTGAFLDELQAKPVCFHLTETP